MKLMTDRKKKLKVRTLNKRTQVIYNFCGAYDMAEGFIELGCDYEHTSTMLWHEVIHKVLFENFDLESCRMWDNIAAELQIYLFNIDHPDRPYIYKSPTARAKSIDDGAWISGKRKQKEKSVKTGWKLTEKKRKPVRSFKDIINIRTSTEVKHF
jgi:hypothetical protein